MKLVGYRNLVCCDAHYAAALLSSAADVDDGNELVGWAASGD